MKKKIMGIALITIVSAMLSVGCAPPRHLSPPPAPPTPPAPGR